MCAPLLVATHTHTLIQNLTDQKLRKVALKIERNLICVAKITKNQ